MKKIILTLIAAVCLTPSFAQKNGGNNQNEKKGGKTTITKQNLPQNSQNTISDYFPSNEVKSVKKDNREDNYDVKFRDGSRVTFDNKGDWNKVSTKKNTNVPRDMVPDKISSYVSKHHGNQKIKSIEKRKDGGYKVTLASGAALLFSSVLAFISMAN